MPRFPFSVFSLQAPAPHAGGTGTTAPAGRHRRVGDRCTVSRVTPATATPLPLQTSAMPPRAACRPAAHRLRHPARLLAGGLLAGLLMPAIAAASSPADRTGPGTGISPQETGTAGGDAGRRPPLPVAPIAPRTMAAITQPQHLAAADNTTTPASRGERASPAASPADATGDGPGRFVLGEELPKATPAPARSTSGHTAGQDEQADPPASAEYRPMDWETLIPADWEPLKDFKSLDFSSMSDSDPRAIAALRKLQKAWKNAPLNPAIQNEKIEISGFIVPLDSSDSTTIEEFLLVPYFGACIHVPPPPSNQVIHVTLDKPLKGFQMMDPVTVTGALRPSRVDTPFGSAGYQLGARDVRPYEDADEDAAATHP